MVKARFSTLSCRWLHYGAKIRNFLYQCCTTSFLYHIYGLTRARFSDQSDASQATRPAKARGAKQLHKKDAKHFSTSEENVQTPQMKEVAAQMLQKQETKNQKKKDVKPQDKPPESVSAGGHLMISYQWSHQKTVLKIRDELRKRNFRVWVDVDHMTGNIMDAMAEAVDGAIAILMCVSSSYKDSKSCKAEAEYADNQRKPIVPLLLEKDYVATGWLGLMLGKKLYFDFSGKYPFDDKMEELVRELERRGLRTQK